MDTLLLIGIIMIVGSLIYLWAAWHEIDKTPWITYSAPIALLLAFLIVFVVWAASFLAYDKGYDDGFDDAHCTYHSAIDDLICRPDGSDLSP